MKTKESVSPYPTQKKVYTYKDYLALPDDRKQYQILEGELVMTPAPFVSHQRISRRLFLQLNQFVERNKLGEVFYSPFDIVLSNTNVLQPDILFLSNEHKKLLTEKNLRGAPDLVVEIKTSPSILSVNINSLTLALISSLLSVASARIGFKVSSLIYGL